MPDDFCVFILTHGRANKVYTYKSLIERNYVGKIYIVIDDEDNTAEEYINIFGKDKVLMFSKKEIAKKFDEADNFNDRRTIVYARNACFELAEKVGCKYFIQFDDDYTDFRYSFDNNLMYTTNKKIKNITPIIKSMLNAFISMQNVSSLAMSQGGDFIGGTASKISKDYKNSKFSRKAMNSFVCSIDRPFNFIGRINEDVNTYTSEANKGMLFLTYGRVRLEQKQTQSNSGGMTEMYLQSGTYVKSFYSVMYQPSSVTVSLMGNTSNRLHHRVNWDNTVPKIINEKFKK